MTRSSRPSSTQATRPPWRSLAWRRRRAPSMPTVCPPCERRNLQLGKRRRDRTGGILSRTVLPCAVRRSMPFRRHREAQLRKCGGRARECVLSGVSAPAYDESVATQYAFHVATRISTGEMPTPRMRMRTVRRTAPASARGAPHSMPSARHRNTQLRKRRIRARECVLSGGRAAHLATGIESETARVEAAREEHPGRVGGDGQTSVATSKSFFQAVELDPL